MLPCAALQAALKSLLPALKLPEGLITWYAAGPCHHWLEARHVTSSSTPPVSWAAAACQAT
jgi:hypothetical protein